MEWNPSFFFQLLLFYEKLYMVYICRYGMKCMVYVGDCFNGNKGGVMVDIHLLFGTLTFLLKWVLSPNMLGLLSILPHKRSFLFVLSTWDCIIQNKFMKLPLHVLVPPYYMFLVQIHTYLHNTHIVSLNIMQRNQVLCLLPLSVSYF